MKSPRSIPWYRPLPPAGPRPHVKICGLTRAADAQLAARLGASFLGFVLARRSPRCLTPRAATELLGWLRVSFEKPPVMVGVFADEPPSEIAELYTRLQLDLVQYHGDPARLRGFIPDWATVPAIGVAKAEDLDVLESLPTEYPAVVLDAKRADGNSGGTGTSFDHKLLRGRTKGRQVFLAGGLTPESIGGAVAGLAAPVRGKVPPLPYAIDLSSGVESEPGIKSEERMRAFFDAYERALAPTEWRDTHRKP